MAIHAGMEKIGSVGGGVVQSDCQIACELVWGRAWVRKDVVVIRKLICDSWINGVNMELKWDNELECVRRADVIATEGLGMTETSEEFPYRGDAPLRRKELKGMIEQAWQVAWESSEKGRGMYVLC